MSRRGRWTPYLLVLPGGLWLSVFFVAPMLVMFFLATQEGDLVRGFQQTFRWQNYTDVLSLYHDQLIRSALYGAAATAIAFVLAYPVAYWICFRGGAHKSTYLFLILMPFFVTFVIRTISWKFVLADEGLVLGPLKDLGLLPERFHVLATPSAVIGGLAYNFLPFMILPIYVALERIDTNLLHAARDLYASRAEVLRRVVLPLSLPGVFAGVILTFVPAMADYVNSSILGGTGQTMIGNAIQTLYITNADYPHAAALSWLLLAAMLLSIFAYARVLGTEDVLEAVAQ